ncbi:MAG TPA: SpoIIE family protein phosphatase [Streptosporangiaceae bacterium]|nr:SpoIIE family protein phosphatase [Streptosporangiaceae bacterium]
MPVAPRHDEAATQVAELEKRHAALRQAATLPGADVTSLLDAAFAELEAALGLLAEPLGAGDQSAGGRQADADATERMMLRAAFTDAPVPLFLLARDGTVLRVNKAGADLLGSKPGYATGRPFTSFVALSGRAAVQSQLNAVIRSGRIGRVSCGLLGAAGPAARDVAIGRVSVSGDNDRLIVAVADRAQDAGPAGAESASGSGGGKSSKARSGRRPASGTGSGAVQAITHRMDLVTAITRLLLENENFSESMTLQRCARLLADELASWVIVDIDRRGQLRRQFVIGPDDPGLAGIRDAAAALNPIPGSLPHTVQESGQAVLIAHADDAEVLGPGPDDVPLLMLLGSTSVLSVPIADRERRYGVLTLARQAGQRHFEIADLGMVEELGEQLALAIHVDHAVRRQTEIADALQASLLPRRLPEIAGVELSAVYIPATESAEIGADFYDAYRTPSGWGLSVGDVCGKGEEAASVTAAARHAIRVIAHDAADPVDVLSGANKILLAEELSGGFVTASIAHLEWQKGALRVALGSAGHPSAAVIRADGRVQLPGGGGLPLGLLDDFEPGTHEVSLNKGDILFLYTDGLTQARGRDRTYFQTRLSDELAGLAGSQPDQFEAGMRRALLQFTAGNLIDDITMMVLRVGDSPERPDKRHVRA